MEKIWTITVFLNIVTGDHLT